MPKILHILDHSLPLQSGYTFRSLNILRVQQSAGWHCAVVTSPKHDLHSGKQSQPEEEIAGIRHYRCPTDGAWKIPGVAELALMRALERRLIEVVGKEAPDILHAHSPILNVLPALRVAKRFRLPIIYEVRALWEDAAVDHGTYKEGSWKYRMTRALETWACRQVDQVTVLCDGLKADLKSRGVAADKLTAVPNGVQVDDFSAMAGDEEYKKAWRLDGKLVIAFLGSFYRYEGLELLVQAFAQLKQRRSDIVLLLVGGGEMEAELKSQIEALGLTDSVVMPGRIPHERIPAIYALADIFVYPRHSMRLTELVTPLKPLEAMAMGGVVVASDIGGHRELIRDGVNGLLIPAGGSDQLAGLLDLVLRNASLRETLGKQASTWVRRERSWEKLKDIYATVYAKASSCPA